MDNKSMKQMAIMVDAVQPYCDEEVEAAITCSHAGSLSSVLISKLMSGAGTIVKSSKLPNPVFLAVGSKTIYAFKYAPRGFKFKIKKEVTRWAKDEVNVTVEKTKAIATFVITTDSGKHFPLEVSIMFGGEPLADLFFTAIGASQG